MLESELEIVDRQIARLVHISCDGFFASEGHSSSGFRVKRSGSVTLEELLLVWEEFIASVKSFVKVVEDV
jgi:hypothetical protein